MPPKKKNTTKKSLLCMACGASEQESKIIVFGEEFSLCEECVAANADKLLNMFPEQQRIIHAAVKNVNAKYSAPHQNVKDPEVAPFTVNVPPPAEIKAFLDQYVVGQEGAKKALAVAVHNHYRRINPVISEKKFKGLDDVEIEKSNILLMGPTGSGKTLLARTLARMLDVPFAIADATTLTEAGYVGEDVENILLSLIQAAGMDIERAKKGIIFVDEIDKIGRRTENVSITRDVSGEGVQQALLKILEGTIARVPPAGGRKHPEQKYLELDTSNILFICGGAFVGLQDIVSKRYAKKHFGFASEADKSIKRKQLDGTILRPDPEDLIKYGMIPEFVGRLPVVAMLNELTEDDLVHILTTPKNCIVKQYKKLFALDGIELEFTDGAIRAIACEALTRKTGARGLRAIMEDLMIDVMYNVDDFVGQKKLVITEEHVVAQLEEPGALVKLLKQGK